jgi:hypothetical protein
MASFSSSAFSTNSFSENAFDFGGVIPPDPSPAGGGGGGGLSDPKQYREMLQRIAKAAEKRLYGEVQEIVQDVAETAPEEIAEAARSIQVEIDFSALAIAESTYITNRLVELIKTLENIVEYSILQEQEEELIILMAIA